MLSRRCPIASPFGDLAIAARLRGPKTIAMPCDALSGVSGYAIPGQRRFIQAAFPPRSDASRAIRKGVTPQRPSITSCGTLCAPQACRQPEGPHHESPPPELYRSPQSESGMEIWPARSIGDPQHDHRADLVHGPGPRFHERLGAARHHGGGRRQQRLARARANGSASRARASPIAPANRGRVASPPRSPSVSRRRARRARRWAAVRYKDSTTRSR